ncbi:potassium-transporting ATPase subunit KdpC [Paenibacillus sp. J22TS3]|uniref:potassium-transporting ATPase subunit KdpC n=1 Tax=Paenibacillus sp. J22TS3 TaxID=2807192 RepID=UPI001B0BFADB|nr:potassium-transporting ATPase subunit KdpC [Paenibacillus sp. J22TS3]GIP21027.1 potassium-transporting ATPase KdpC subunit [Paenibacillus sp. J22TS3]
MLKSVTIAIRLSLVLMLICGVVYPLVTTGVAQAVFHDKANGSLVESGGKVIGSELLGQKFDSPKWFHSRPSAGDYDAAASTGSNRAVASSEYAKEMKEKIASLYKENPGLQSVPADLVTASGSGLDPDLSPEGAKAQIPRVSKETGISEQQLNRLIDDHTTGRQLGVFGEPRVNVLELNQALLSEMK